jgi:hypothetical protein
MGLPTLCGFRDQEISGLPHDFLSEPHRMHRTEVAESTDLRKRKWRICIVRVGRFRAKYAVAGDRVRDVLVVALQTPAAVDAVTLQVLFKDVSASTFSSFPVIDSCGAISSDRSRLRRGRFIPRKRDFSNRRVRTALPDGNDCANVGSSAPCSGGYSCAGDRTVLGGDGVL